MTAKRQNGKMIANRSMSPPYPLLQDVSNPVFKKELSYLEDFLRIVPEVGL